VLGDVPGTIGKLSYSPRSTGFPDARRASPRASCFSIGISDRGSENIVVAKIADEENDQALDDIARLRRASLIARLVRPSWPG